MDELLDFALSILERNSQYLPVFYLSSISVVQVRWFKLATGGV